MRTINFVPMCLNPEVMETEAQQWTQISCIDIRYTGIK